MQTAIFYNLVPVFAAIFAAIYLHERLGFYQILGGLCIIGGVTLTRLPPLAGTKQPDGSINSNVS